MLSPFAALDQIVNNETTRHLADAVASLDDGEPFGVVLIRGLEMSLNIVEGCSLMAGFDLRRAPGLKQGKVLVVDGTRYRVVGGLQPDSSGWVDVQLREA